MYMEAIEGVENVSVLTLLFCSEKKKQGIGLKYWSWIWTHSLETVLQ